MDACDFPVTSPFSLFWWLMKGILVNLCPCSDTLHLMWEAHRDMPGSNFSPFMQNISLLKWQYALLWPFWTLMIFANRLLWLFQLCVAPCSLQCMRNIWTLVFVWHHGFLMGETNLPVFIDTWTWDALHMTLPMEPRPNRRKQWPHGLHNLCKPGTECLFDRCNQFPLTKERSCTRLRYTTLQSYWKIMTTTRRNK